MVEFAIVCFHTSTEDRMESIEKNGLVPSSDPNWFGKPVDYVMLSPTPWMNLHKNKANVIYLVQDPAIKREYFEDPEGLRWPHVIKPEYLTLIWMRYDAS